jgi:succinyl-CoA synthetase beta subunit
MNIHEYQAKQVLKSFGVAVQEGIVAETADEAHAAALKLKEQYGSDFVVVKAQIHAGGRGKGTIVGKEQRGVAVAKNADKAKEIAGNILDLRKSLPVLKITMMLLILWIKSIL